MPTVSRSKSLFLRVFFKRGLSFIGLLVATTPVFGQILDDTTQQNFDAAAVRYFTEADLRFNRDTLHSLDTTIDEMVNINWVDQGHKKYQNLGVVGTAQTSVFMELPDQVGARSGYHAYDRYYRGSEQVKFWDAKKPYTNLYVIFGQQQRNMVDAQFTRNVNNQWNVGGDMRVMLVDRQIGRQTRGDRTVVSYNYDFYTSYRSRDAKYWATASFARWLHRAYEPGGVDTTQSDYFPSLSTQPFNSRAYSEDLRQQYRVFHQYAFSDLFQVYHTFEKYRQNNYYYDLPNLGAEGFYGGVAHIATDSTKDRFSFRYISNEVGLKGNLGKATYSIGYRRRDGVAPYKYLDLQEEFHEDYITGFGRYRFNRRHGLSAYAEFMRSGQYRVDLNYYNKFFRLRWKRRYYQPAMVAQTYFGNHDEWYNNFDNSLVDQVQLSSKIKTGPVVWKPKLDLSILDKYVYWDEAGNPQQTTLFGQVITAGGEANLTLGSFHLDNEVLYSTTSGQANLAVSIPEVFVNSSAYFKGSLFDDALFAKAGVNFHTWSAYYRYGYDPVVQQFTVQRSQLSEGWYPLLDAFMVLKIGPANVIMRFNNVLSELFDTEQVPGWPQGYLITAGYPGLPRRFDIGVRWFLFN